MTGIHGQKGGEMLQYLEMSAVLPAGFSQLAHERSRFAHLKRGNAYLRSKKQKIRKETKLWQRLRSAKKKKNV